MSKQSEEKLQELLKKAVGEALGEALAPLSAQLDKVSRTVNAIETMPVPYGRPKAYVSATEFHSVSNPVRVRQGQNG